MQSFKQYLVENREITRGMLARLEAHLDALWKSLGIDVEFTRHFLDRVNDPRNRQQITIDELLKLYREQYRKHGPRIQRLGRNTEAVMKDLETDINSPFVLKWNQKNGMFELTAKTIMRKRNFKSPDRAFVVP